MSKYEKYLLEWMITHGYSLRYEARLRKAISVELTKTAYLQPVAAIQQCRAIELPIPPNDTMRSQRRIA